MWIRHERRTVRQKLRLDYNKISIEYYLFFFHAVNTFFLILCGLIHFGLWLQLVRNMENMTENIFFVPMFYVLVRNSGILIFFQLF